LENVLGKFRKFGSWSVKLVLSKRTWHDWSNFDLRKVC